MIRLAPPPDPSRPSPLAGEAMTSRVLIVAALLLLTTPADGAGSLADTVKPPPECASAKNANECADILKKLGKNPFDAFDYVDGRAPVYGGQNETPPAQRPFPWNYIYDWQTLIAGLLALVAALIAVGGSEWRARKALRTALASEIRLYVDFLIRARKTFITLEPSFLAGKSVQRNLKALAVLHPPTVYPAAAAGTMGLLRRPRAPAVVDFYATIERFNFAAKAISNEPNEKVSPPNYLELIDLIEQVCRRSLPLLSELPFDKRDAEFRAEIAKWDAVRPDERAAPK